MSLGFQPLASPFLVVSGINISLIPNSEMTLRRLLFVITHSGEPSCLAFLLTKQPLFVRAKQVSPRVQLPLGVCQYLTESANILFTSYKHGFSPIKKCQGVVLTQEI